MIFSLIHILTLGIYHMGMAILTMIFAAPYWKLLDLMEYHGFKIHRNPHFNWFLKFVFVVAWSAILLTAYILLWRSP